MSLLWFIIILLLAGRPEVASAESATASCSEAAAAWIDRLTDGVDREMLLRHTAADCSFSGKWVAEYAEVVDEGRRRRMCNDLVLIWTYKKCVYYRDYASPECYQPCMHWVRTMFSQCMANRVDWFAEVPAPANQIR